MKEDMRDELADFLNERRPTDLAHVRPIPIRIIGAAEQEVDAEHAPALIEEADRLATDQDHPQSGVGD